MLGHPSDVLLQLCLTLPRSDAMGTCKVQGAWIPIPPFLAVPPQIPTTTPAQGEGKTQGQSHRLASLTFPSSFHCPSQFSRFQKCQTVSEKSKRSKIY